MGPYQRWWFFIGSRYNDIRAKGDYGRVEVLSDTNTISRVEEFKAEEFAAHNRSSAQLAVLQSPFIDHLADDAKVWTLYLEATKPKGEELTRVWNSDLDTILIFAGLFSAILTAFLIETRKQLQPDSQNLTNQYLNALIGQLQSHGQPANLAAIQAAYESYTPSAAFRWINGLWFVALTFSLAGAFGSILAKGWVAQFIPISAGVPVIDAYNRHRRFFGDDQLHLRAVITTLPVTLHVGFYLFFVGLILLLFQDDVRIGIFVTILLAFTMLLYFGCSLRPIVNPHSPFRTPLSGMIPIIPLLFLPFIFIADVFGHLWFTPGERRYRQKYKETERPYTTSEVLCRWFTATRKLWTLRIRDAMHTFSRVIQVATPLPAETGINVLVGLFAISRTQHSLDDCIYALAALPATPELQHALHSIDPLPALIRNVVEIFSDPVKMDAVGLPQAYLNVLLSLVQTTYSRLNWAPSSIMPLLERGGVLAPADTYPTQVLELIYCIQVHVRVRSGFLLPDNLITELSKVIMRCTSPYHQQLLIEASLTLAVVDNGVLVERLVLDESMSQSFLNVEIEFMLASMLSHPQKRIQTAALISISRLCINEEIRKLLIKKDIIKLLLDHLPGGDSDLQCKIMSTLLAFVRQPVKTVPDYDSISENYSPEAMHPWIERIFNLLLAAVMSKQHLNVQETGISTLVEFLEFEVAREEFVHLGHIDTLLQLLSMNEDISFQLAALQILTALLDHGELQSVEICTDISQKFTTVLPTCSHLVKKEIFDFLYSCIISPNGNIQAILSQECLSYAFKLYSDPWLASDTTDIVSKFIYTLSTLEIQQKLMEPRVISSLLKAVTTPVPSKHSPFSINITQKTLLNLFSNGKNHRNFEARVLWTNQSEIQILFNCIEEHLEAILHTSRKNIMPESKKFLLTCLLYDDLRQMIYSSKVVSNISYHLEHGQGSLVNDCLNILLEIASHSNFQIGMDTPTIVNALLNILENKASRLSGKSLLLLVICFQKGRNLSALLTAHAQDTLLRLIKKSDHQSNLGGLTLVLQVLLSSWHGSHNMLPYEIIPRVSYMFTTSSYPKIQELTARILKTCASHEHWRPVLQYSNTAQKILHSGLITDPSFQTIALDVLSYFEKYGLIEHQVVLDTLHLQSIEEGHILAMHTQLDFQDSDKLNNSRWSLGERWDTDSDVYDIYAP